jgi:hypothetical protein
VLHGDRVGDLQLAAGNYTVTVLDSSKLSCAHASDLFRQFLEDFDGRLPRPWTLDAATATFTRAEGDGFSVAFTSVPSGGGGGGHHPSGTTCPSFFRVLHNDVIGSLRLPAGEYRITLLAVGRFTCARAAARFADFLADFDGRLPRPWVLDPQTGTFSRSAHVGFRVKLAAGDPAQADPAGVHPTGARCPGTFRVRNDDRIGRLSLPKGRYRITRLRPSALSCADATDLLAEFLQFPAGDLPSPWVLNVQQATFRRGRNSGVGFRVKPA